jgi:hypothetical protein
MPTDCDDRGGAQQVQHPQPPRPFLSLGDHENPRSQLQTPDQGPERPKAIYYQSVTTALTSGVMPSGSMPRPYPVALSASMSGDPMRRLLTATRMRTVRLDVRNDGTF